MLLTTSKGVLLPGLLVSCTLVLQACGGSSGSTLSVDTTTTDTTGTATSTTGTTTTAGRVNITDAIFTNRSADCVDYVNDYEASATDIKNALDFQSDVTISTDYTTCTITSNSVPNHNFNDASAAFAGGADGATIAEIDATYTVQRYPVLAATSTALSQEVTNAVFLNGVVLDLLSAGCYRPNDPSAGADGNTGIGCSTSDPWLLDPLGTESKFGADAHNAHTQPEGLYHYHGSPNAMFDNNPGSAGSPAIGFAADGFPIYGSYFNDGSHIRKALSGYTLKVGARGTKSDTNPGGTYDGTYNNDWSFTNSGDLDACNGMWVNGQYGYYVTDSYPWVMGCISGTPNASFSKGGGTGGPAAGGPPPGV